MVSLYLGKEKVSSGYVVHTFKHYLFGGLIEAPYVKPNMVIKGKEQPLPRIIPTNDIVEVTSSFIEIKSPTSED
jgi:hypothetical protein